MPPEPVSVKTGEKYFKMNQMSQKEYFSRHNNLGTVGKMKSKINDPYLNFAKEIVINVQSDAKMSDVDNKHIRILQKTNTVAELNTADKIVSLEESPAHKKVLKSSATVSINMMADTHAVLANAV